MKEDYKESVADFLSKYVDITDQKYSYKDEKIIKQALNVLVNEGIFTAEELQKEALRVSGVFIPLDFINMCAKNRYG